jgi:hypothetical protein
LFAKLTTAHFLYFLGSMIEYDSCHRLPSAQCWGFLRCRQMILHSSSTQFPSEWVFQHLFW